MIALALALSQPELITVEHVVLGFFATVMAPTITAYIGYKYGRIHERKGYGNDSESKEWQPSSSSRPQSSSASEDSPTSTDLTVRIHNRS
jgi:hypothetical protein